MPDKLAYSRSVKPDEPAVITELVGRRLAHPFAVLAFKLGLSPNAVTVLAGLCWVASTPLAVFAGWLVGGGRRDAGLAVWFLCGFLWNAGYVLDLADGSLARMTGRASRRGFYLDYVFHLLFKPAFLASIGVGLFLAHGGGLGWLLLAVLSIPANWSASASASSFRGRDMRAASAAVSIHRSHGTAKPGNFASKSNFSKPALCATSIVFGKSTDDLTMPARPGSTVTGPSLSAQPVQTISVEGWAA